MQKVLVTGSSGLLGAHLMTALSLQSEEVASNTSTFPRYAVFGVDRHPWWGDCPLSTRVGDLTDPRFLEETVCAIKPEILIHCAAWTNVDGCEQNPQEAYVCHEKITRKLISLVPSNCLLVYISTDSVFKGDEPFATEEKRPSPRTVYARSKLHGEWEIEQASENHLIVRTNFYGWGSGRKQTAGEWLYQALETGQEITLFNDFYFTPIYVLDFIKRLIRLIEGEHRGLFHLVGQERVSKFQFGALMAELGGFSFSHVREGSIDESSLKARRSKDISLQCDHFRKATGLDLPDCQSGLKHFLFDRKRPLSKRFLEEAISVGMEGKLR